MNFISVSRFVHFGKRGTCLEALFARPLGAAPASAPAEAPANGGRKNVSPKEAVGSRSTFLWQSWSCRELSLHPARLPSLRIVQLLHSYSWQ